MADALRPIVVITSNSEKALPEPFLRRCIYYDIPFPSATRLLEILIARTPGEKPPGGALLKDALKFFRYLREEAQLQRRISTAELLQWLTFMRQMKAASDRKLKESQAIAFQGLHALVKNADDQPAVRSLLERFIKDELKFG
ncbi:hypothetical protein ACN28I_42955 [Archangium gephyra]|uniref:hypothetical protein n=1 Tax=Archangium gephyra TaxID=48 RepID=UPI003B78F221